MNTDIWGMPVIETPAVAPDEIRLVRFQDQVTAPMGLVIDSSVPMGLAIISGPETCPHCDGPTQKTGSCYTCIVCGSTTGCG